VEAPGQGKSAPRVQKKSLSTIYRKPKTSTPNQAHRIYPYLLRDLRIDRPNQAWCSDITYIPMQSGFQYLVAIMAWGNAHGTLLAHVERPGQRLLCRGPTRGAGAVRYAGQFTSDFTDVLKEAGVRVSMDARESGKNAPRAYASGEEGFLEMLRIEQLDLVVIATAWEWHAPMCVAAMKAGAHAAVVVPAAVTVEECWDLVHTAEQTRRHCIMLENENYFQYQIAILEMVRSG
jgi:hypothetical protein